MEWISYLLTVLGLVLLVVLWRRGPIDMDEPAPAAAEGVGGGDVLADWSPPTGQALPEAAGDPTPPAGLERPLIEELREPGSDAVGIERESSHVEEVEASDEDGVASDEDGATPDEDEATPEVDDDTEPEVDDDTEPDELPAADGASPKDEEEPPPP
jgi:hypothetical protein